MIMDKNKNKQKNNEEDDSEEFVRVKLPKDNEVFGILESRLGSSRSRVICSDGKIRICRIPGRLKKSLWVRPEDILIIKPWEFEGDQKGDIIYKYRPSQVNWLRKKGYLNFIEDIQDF